MACIITYNSKKYTESEFKNFLLSNGFNDSKVRAGLGYKTPTAPFVTDTNSWVRLSLKVALKEAVNQNVDKIAWTTGEQQNDRYDLSKSVDSIEVSNQGEGVGYKVVGMKDGNMAMTQIATAQQLPDVIGKELAQKIIDAKIPYQKTKVFSGVDLKLGGKGMKGFYGSPKEGSLGIVGNVAKSLFKQEPKTTKIVIQEQDVKLSNESFDMSEAPKDLQDLVEKYSEGIEDGDYAELQKFKNEAKLIGYEVNYDLDGVVTSFKRVSGKPTLSTQYSIDVTPELKLSVNNGLPLFGSEISTEQALKDTIARELNKSANELGSFNIGSTKLWLSMAKLMGLYSKKGVTKFGDFIKATGYKATSALKSLWDAIRNRKQTTISKSVKNSKLRTLNARVLFYEALIGVDPLADGQTQLDALKDTIATYKTLAIHANKNEVQDVINAVDALSDLYIELSADLNTVKDKIASQAANGKDVIELQEKINLGEEAIKFFADDFLWQEKVQNEIEKSKGELPDEMNPYMQRDISIGRVENTISNMTQKLFGKRFGELKTNKRGTEAFFGRAAKDKISQEDLDFFLYVQHAKERNARVERLTSINKAEAIQEAQDKLDNLAKKDQNDPDVQSKTIDAKQELSDAQSMEIVTDGSGMSNDEADRFMQEFEKTGKLDKYEAYAKEYRDIVINPMIDMLEEGNILDADQAEMLRTGMDEKTGVKFDYYIPLKVSEKALEDVASTGRPTIVQPIKSIKGTSKYDYVKRNSVIAQSMLDFQAAAKAVEDNKIAQSLYKLVKENPNKKIWEIIEPFKDGQTIDKTSQADRDASIVVKVNGKLKYIKLNHEGLRDSWKRHGKQKGRITNLIAQAIRTYYNFKRKSLTTYSPEFLLSNFPRDLQSSVFNSSGVDIPFLGKQIIGNLKIANTTAAKALAGNLDPNSEKGKLLDLYLSNGGKISWANYTTIDELNTELQKLGERFKENKSLGYYGKEFFKNGVAAIGAFNETVEVGTRLALFKALVDNGIAPGKAASISKNMTVNFNKKGTATPILSALWLFSNAGIQDTYTGFKNFVKSPKTRRYAAYVMTTAFALPFAQRFLISALSESDDDEKEYLQLLTEEDQTNYFVIPSGDKKFIRVAKTYGLMKLFFNSGQEIGEMMIDGDIERHAANILSTIYSTIDPITGSAMNFESAVSPTVFRPFVEVNFLNRKYNNAPVYPEDRFGPESPDYLKTYPKTNEIYKNFAENIYFRSGSKMDVSPETFQYIINDFFGGVFKTGENLVTAGMGLASGKELDPNKIPFKSKFMVDMSEQEWRYTKDFYNIYNNSEKVLYQKEEIEEVIKLVKKLDAKRQKENGPPAIKEMQKKINLIYESQEKLKERKEAFEKKQQK